MKKLILIIFCFSFLGASCPWNKKPDPPDPPDPVSYPTVPVDVQVIWKKNPELDMAKYRSEVGYPGHILTEVTLDHPDTTFDTLLIDYPWSPTGPNYEKAMYFLIFEKNPESVSVITSSPDSSFGIKRIASGTEYYLDRNYYLDSYPDYFHQLYLVAPRNDNKNGGSINFDYFSDDTSRVYLVYDNRDSSLPQWVSDYWMSIENTVSVSDTMARFEIFYRDCTNIYPWVFRVFAIDSSGNESLPSDPVEFKVRRPKKILWEDAGINFDVHAQ